MAQGTQCLHAISNYMRKVELKYQHVIGHNYTTIQQFKESRDKKNYLHDVISGIPGINMLPRVSLLGFFVVININKSPVIVTHKLKQCREGGRTC